MAVVTAVAPLLVSCGWVWLITAGMLAALGAARADGADPPAPPWPQRRTMRGAASLAVVGASVVLASFLLPWGTP